MANHSYEIEVQSDYLQKITRAKPLQAIAELIWNSLDADATSVDVVTEQDGLGVMRSIRIIDNGVGFSFEEAPDLFKKLGGSWKSQGGTTKTQKRFLHGQEGRGRFKSFALGRVAEWIVTYSKNGEPWTFSILMTADNMRTVTITDESVAPSGSQTGVEVTISELHKDFRFILSDSGAQELAEIFALYLTNYSSIRINVNTVLIDPSTQITSRVTIELNKLLDGEKSFTVELDVIEWQRDTARTLFLCNAHGFPLAEVDRRFHVGPYHFSAYLKSKYIENVQSDGALELYDSNPALITAIADAQQALRMHFRERAATDAKSVVDEWKRASIYPFEGEATSTVDKVERQVFDIVAVSVANNLTDFSASPQKNKALHLRLLKQAIEKSPDELQLILDEVLKLPKRTQSELAALLKDVSLSSIIGAAKVITDRLQFLTGLEAILFDYDKKPKLKERTQLHKIVADNCWLFGEEYNLSVSDRSLTEVLIKHRALLGEDVVIDSPVKHISKERGIVDLMLSRVIRNHKPNELTHLVVELKAPKVKIDSKAVVQIQEYAFSVIEDERFSRVGVNWVFWALSDDHDSYTQNLIKDSTGTIHTKDNVSIMVKTWAQILDDNRSRLQFFQEKLQFESDKDDALEFLQSKYAKFLEGVLELNESTSEPIPEALPSRK